MTELKVTLPDRLAREARNAGLLKPKAIKALLREAMRRRAAARKFLAVADRVAAAAVPPMSEEKVQAEIDAMRIARSLDQIISKLPAKRRAKIEERAGELASLVELRQALERTQKELAASLGVGQDTVSRIERRSDILLSTLRRYVEGIGGKLELVARFPDRPPLVIEHIAATRPVRAKQRAVAKRAQSQPHRAGESRPASRRQTTRS